MPSYFSVKNTGAAIPAFVQKKIPDQMPGAVGDVPVFIAGKVATPPHRRHLSHSRIERKVQLFEFEILG
jgi:hypothetical protein